LCGHETCSHQTGTLRVFENRVLARGRKWEGRGEKCAIRSFLINLSVQIFTGRQILLGRQKSRRMRWVRYVAWNGRYAYEILIWKLEERGNLVYLGVYGRKNELKRRGKCLVNYRLRLRFTCILILTRKDICFFSDTFKICCSRDSLQKCFIGGLKTHTQAIGNR
jgi:hypothetical protein